MTKFEYWLWGIAEKKNWYAKFPRTFWRWLLRYLDRKAGYGRDTTDQKVTVTNDCQKEPI